MQIQEIITEDPTNSRTSAVDVLKKDLKNPLGYDAIDHMMTTIAGKHGITPKKLHDLFVEKTGMIPDEWIKQNESPRIHHRIRPAG